MPENNDELKKYLDYDGLAYLLQRFTKTTVHCVFDDEFAGETATLTHGTTTYTKTVPATSPYELTFAVNELGTWTLQSSYLGTQYSDTVDITYLGQKGEVELAIVPDGSTAEPVNSIQVWLKCANLNKSYTTLAEVLADTETYETLLADSNACQYMKRSTEWANPGLVPKMTSRTTPEGIADANSEYSSTFQAWKAFDGTNIGGAASDSVDCWASTGPNEFPKYLQYMFDTPKIVRRVKVTTRNTDTATDLNSPKEVTFKAYNGTSYDTLGTFTNTEATTSNTSFEFTVNNNTAYQYYMLEINSINKTTAGTGNTDYYCTIGQMQYYEYADASIVDDQYAMARLGKFDYASNLLLSDSTWCEAIANSDYIDYVMNTSVPKMTGNTTPSGTVLKSREVSSFEAYKAFDKNNSTVWIPIRSTTSINGDFIGYAFTSPVCIKKVKIIGNRFKNATIQASNDGTTYTPLKNIDLGGGDSDFSVDEILDNDISYTHYMLKFTSVSTNVDCHISELQFYGRATEEVLVPLVPTMTSATTPSGEVISSGHSTNYDAWKAFDNDDTTEAAVSAAANGYIGYRFVNPTCVNAFRIYDNNTKRLLTFKIQASNTGETDDWIDVSDVMTMPSSYDYTAEVRKNGILNTKSYYYYRVLQVTTSFSANVAYKTIQFYQKTVQTNIIHSAANDTIYMLEDGDPIVLATTNSDGDGILDFSQLSAGPVTLYSSVAKNPEDLTADYSKTITITKTQYGGTTEAYLMPDTIKTLYWWGYVGNIEAMSTANGWTSTNGNFANPTWNVNSISLATNTNNYYMGVGTKSPLTLNSVNFHVIGNWSVSGSGIAFSNTESSKLGVGGNQVSAIFNTADIGSTEGHYISGDITTNNEIIGFAIINASANATMKAWWYE